MYVHLNFEQFKPMVMEEKEELPSEEAEEEKSVKFPDITKGSSSKQSSFNKIISGGSQLKESNPSPRTAKESNSKKPRAQVFQLFRMVPPSMDGIQFYYSLQNPKNFKKEIFIDQYKKKVFIE